MCPLKGPKHMAVLGQESAGASRCAENGFVRTRHFVDLEDSVIVNSAWGMSLQALCRYLLL